MIVNTFTRNARRAQRTVPDAALTRRDAALHDFLVHWGPARVPHDVFDSFSRRTHDPELLHALDSIGLVETNSIQQLGNALAARVGDDPWLSEFLPRWAAEEAEHGQMLRRLAHAGQGDVYAEGALVAVRDVATMRKKRIIRQRYSRLIAAGAARAIPHMPALYATFGAYQEHSVMQAYRLLRRRAASPEVDSVLRVITEQEARHFRVYFAQAALELQSEAAQQAVRRCMLRFWKPVGLDAMGAANWKRVTSYICPDSESTQALCRTDDVIGQLPGVATMGLMRSAMQAMGFAI